MARTKAKGREERRGSQTAASHTPDLSRFYRYALPDLHPGAFAFELALLRPRQKPMPLDHLVDTFNWIDEQAALTGSLTIHRPVPTDPSSLPIARGHLVRCRVRWAGGLYELWTMRADAPQVQKDTASVNVTLQDVAALLEAGNLDWIFRKTKRRPHGYRCDEIAAAVARRLGLKVGKLARGSHRMALVMRGASGLDVLRKAYASEKQIAGGSYVIRIRNGRLEIVPLQRNPVVYTLADEIQTALIAQKAGSKVPTTVLTGRAQLHKGKASKKISYTSFDRRVVSQLGYVPDTKNYGVVGSHAELRDKVKRDLAAGLRLNDTVTITHQGIPFIWRGDGAKLKLPEEGYGGDRAFVYCTRANHTVQAGTYTAEFAFDQADPYLAEFRAEQKAAKQRAAKRAQRSRKKLHG